MKPFTGGPGAIDLGTKTASTLGLTGHGTQQSHEPGLLQIGDSSGGAITISAALTQVSSLALSTRWQHHSSVKALPWR